MKKISRAEALREADAYTINHLKVPGLLLMECAAGKVVERLKTLASKKDDILVLCGTGNNAGDGFACARMLKSEGYQVRVFFLGSRDKLKDDAKVNFDMLSGYQVSVLSMDQASAFSQLAKETEWVVDALFGIGLNREVKGMVAQTIEKVNELHDAGKLKVLAIDVPSGIDANTGKVFGCAVKADETVTFSRMKPGLLLYPGREYAGNVTVENIGIPEYVPSLSDCREFQLEDADLRKMIPQRASRSHKGLYGRLFLAAGSETMMGACVFAGEAAYRVGTGLVQACVPEQAKSVLMMELPEAVTMPYDEEGPFDFLEDALQNVSACVAGPGLSKKLYAGNLLKAILTYLPKYTPLLLDADALNLIAEEEELKALVRDRGGNTVLTPHMGEASRLSKMPIAEIMANPVGYAEMIGNEYNAVVVLKDAVTIVRSLDGRLFYNSTGNNGMSTAGSGDVLSGMIGGLLAEGMKPFEAACCGVYAHGKAGDFAREERGAYSMTASDILSHIHMEKIIGGSV